MKKPTKMKIISVIGMATVFFFLSRLLESANRKGEYAIGKGIMVWHIVQNNANIYLVKTPRHYLMIDSGNPDKAEKLLTDIQKIGINPSDIDYLILTHAHPDHAGNTRHFQEKYGTKVIAGLGEEDLIKNKGEDINLCPTGFLGRIIQKTVAQKRYKPFVPDLTIGDSFNLKELGIQGTIFPIPGHTKGSLVISIGNAVFVGDIIRGKALQNKKPARHIFVCDFDQDLMNIETVAKIKGIQTWFPGHGGPLNQNDVLRFIHKEKSK